MKKVIQFPASNSDGTLGEIREQASQWLALLNAGASTKDEVLFGQWMSEDTLHVEVLLEMADLWDQMDVLSELSSVFPLEQYAPQPKASAQRRGLIVAGISVFGCAAIFNPFTLDKLGLSDSSALVISEFSYETAVGEQLTVDLPDGSQIMLNTATKVDVIYFSNERQVNLKQGEGLFTVAKDKTRSFRVYAGNRIVEAVGTTFTVQRIAEENIEVIVREGQVNFFRFLEEQVTNNIGTDFADTTSDNVPLFAGEYAVTDNNFVKKRSIQPEEIEARLAWNHGMLLFQGEPLQQVLIEMGRYTLILVEADPAIQDISVEGYFRAGDINGLLVAMQNNFQINAQYLKTDHILLIPD